MVSGGHRTTQRKILDLFLKYVLPDAMRTIEQECEQAGCYAVLIGGVCVERCVANDKVARRLLKGVMTEDVDVKFVMTSEGGGGESAANRVMKIRDRFLEDVMRRIESDGGRFGKLTLTIDDRFLNHPHPEVRARAVKSIMVSLGGGGLKWSLLDTGIVRGGVANTHYKTLAAVSRAPKKTLIPYYKPGDGTTYATCEYVYLDTVRMLMDRAKYFADKKSMFALFKFYRYVLKFMALWVLMKDGKTRGGLSPKMHVLYHEVHKRLAGLDPEVILSGFGAMHGVKYDETMVESVQNLLKDVINATNVRGLAEKLDLYKP